MQKVTYPIQEVGKYVRIGIDMKNINLKTINLDGSTQSRVHIDHATVEDYAQVLRDGGELPAVVVFFDGADNWLGDGFHRWHAYNSNQRASIPADVRTGTQRDAMLYSFGANGAHGLRRTNEDKRKAVAGMLADAEWSTWSDRKIAEQCGVSHTFVANIRTPKVATVATPVPNNLSDDVRTGITRPDVFNAPADAALAPQAAESSPAEQPQDASAADADELAAAEAEQAAEVDALHVLIGADDKLSAAFAEVKRQAALIRILEERIRGLQNGLNEQIRLTKSWRKKFEAEQRAGA